MFINLTAQAGDWQKTNIAGMDLWLYIPSGNVHSLMVSLHGCDQTPDDLKVYGNWTSSADSHNMIVAIPWVPNGGVIFGCWDYYGSNHTRTNRDNGPVIDLTEKLISDKSMNIDPNQVYISGVSSGGTQALIEACLRPDLYAGVGVNSGAALGTNAFQTAFPPSNGDSSARICKNLAGDLAGYLETQITSIIVGSADVSVNPKHSLDNGEAMSSVYGATKTNNLDTSQLKGRNNSGIGTLVTELKIRSGCHTLLTMGSTTPGHQENWLMGKPFG